MLSRGAGNFNFDGDVARATLTLDAQSVGVIRLPCRWARGRRELTGGTEGKQHIEREAVRYETAARRVWAAVPAAASIESRFYSLLWMPLKPLLPVPLPPCF